MLNFDNDECPVAKAQMRKYKSPERGHAGIKKSPKEISL